MAALLAYQNHVIFNAARLYYKMRYQLNRGEHTAEWGSVVDRNLNDYQEIYNHYQTFLTDAVNKVKTELTGNPLIFDSLDTAFYNSWNTLINGAGVPVDPDPVANPA